MKILKIIILTNIIIISILFTTACDKVDLGSEDINKAFNSLNEILDENSSEIGYHKVLKHWNITFSTNEKFEWSKDTGANKADYAMVLIADEFTKAGLDYKKLDEENWIYKEATVEDGKNIPNLLIHPFNISDKNETSNGWKDALKRDFRKSKDIIKYDKKLVVHRLLLGAGFEVQWNDKKEMKFFLNADLLKNAGLDVNKIKVSGWDFNTTTSLTPEQLVKELSVK